MFSPASLFEQLGGDGEAGFPALHSPVLHSQGGTPYLTHPGVVVLARPQTNLAGMAGFLAGYGEESHFSEYLDDPTPLPDGAQLAKVAGQLCYMSFGRKRSLNERAERYFTNLKASGHGSVFEHANYSLLLYGISRSVTHELVRHRAGMGYCLSGDTLIYGATAGSAEALISYRLADLYALSRTEGGLEQVRQLSLRCLDEQAGIFTAGTIRTILCSGEKPVMQVTLADGKTIIASKEHRFLTPHGWSTLEEIMHSGRSEIELLVNGRLLYTEASVSSILVPEAVRIISILPAGTQMTYDIEMAGEHHNFVANGIVTHNSQQSQRYVSGSMLRFVERPEYRVDEVLHQQFLARIERSAAAYAETTERILSMQQDGVQILSAEQRTDLRKKVQQTARSVLPNETEAPIVVTGNVRSWRHVISMRASAHAETEIRELAVRMFLCLYQAEPVLFNDYTLQELADGTFAVHTDFEKI